MPRQGDGNLLSENNQSFLDDASGWTASGATLSYQPTAQVVAPTLDPVGCVRLTSSGTADSVLTLATPVPVTPGQEYVGYGWFAPATARTMTVTATLHWLNGSGVEISTSPRARTEAFAVGSYRASTYGVAPVGAETAKVSVRCTNAATGAQVYWDLMYLGQPVQGNLLSFPDFTSDYALAPWVSESGAITRERAILLDGDGDMTVGFAPDGDGTHSLTLDRWVPITGGDTYAVTAHIATLATDPNATASVRGGLEFRNAAGETTLDFPEPFHQYQGAVGVYVGVTTDRTYTAPADAVEARAVVQVYQSVSNHADLYFIDAVAITPSVPDYVLAVDDALGMVSLSVYDRPALDGDVTVSVYRMGEDGSQVPLRGYGHEMVDRPYNQEDIFLEDYEAAVSTRVYYRIRWASDTGATSQIDTRTVLAPQITDGSYVWVKSPGNPALNTMVMMAENPSWSMAARSAGYEVIGRAAPVMVSEVRASRTGTLKVRLADWDTNDVARQLLASGLPLLMQAAPGHGMDGNHYFAVGDASYAPENWNATQPGWLWTLDVTEIDRPVGGLQGSASRTWQDVLDEFETWDDVFAAYGTWLDVQTGG